MWGKRGAAAAPPLPRAIRGSRRGASLRRASLRAARKQRAALEYTAHLDTALPLGAGAAGRPRAAACGPGLAPALRPRRRRT